jgi:hypothetical protein
MLGLGGSPEGGVGSYFVSRKHGAPADLDRCSRATPAAEQSVGGVRVAPKLGFEPAERRGPRFGREALDRLRQLCGESLSLRIERPVAGRRRGPLRSHVLRGGRPLLQRRRLRLGERLPGVRLRLFERLLQPRATRAAGGSRSLRNKDRVRPSMRCVPRHLRLRRRLRLRPEPVRLAPAPARRRDVSVAHGTHDARLRSRDTWLREDLPRNKVQQHLQVFLLLRDPRPCR